jgi:hypothetical protein
MSNLMIPGPGAEPEKTGQDQTHTDTHDAKSDDRHGHRQHSGKADIPTEEDCLRAIAHAARLAALGVFKPSVANTVRSAFRDILQHHRSKTKETEKNVANADVLEAVRNDPKMLSLLEPYLTQDMIDSLMKNA